ncbi:MAG: glycosyltransferase [Bacteroidales bacterium]|jgi:1,2-diacylglycerol 3-alpha-glucosyltransferase|nr:glycosyltransferase [Bacteroidales bacterium]
MRIGFFTNYYTPSIGGIETSVANLCKGLKRAGHEIFIFSPQYPNWIDNNENIFPYKSIHFNYFGYFYVIPIPFFSKMDLIVKRLNLDIIHSHQPYSLGIEALKFSKKLNIPLVFTHHINYREYYHYIPFIPKSISQKYITRATSTYSNKCDVVIAPSISIKKLLLDHEVKVPIEIIPSGININEFIKIKGKKDDIRERYGINPEDVVLITASRITQEKNIPFLINSFLSIKKSCENSKFIIIGDGAAKKTLGKLTVKLDVYKDVFFTGHIKKEEVISLFQASDIFIFSSLTETQGIVLIEAIISGLPVVAIKSNGIEDIVQNGENGILTVNSVDEFSKSVLQIINNDELRGKLSNKANFYAKNYSIELWVEKIIKLYNNLIFANKTP